MSDTTPRPPDARAVLLNIATLQILRRRRERPWAATRLPLDDQIRIDFEHLTPSLRSTLRPGFEALRSNRNRWRRFVRAVARAVLAECHPNEGREKNRLRR